MNTFIPDTPWRDQDTTPRPVPEADSDGNPWRVTDDGRHVGTHNGDEYCLEWLPVNRDRETDCGPQEGLEREEASAPGRWEFPSPPNYREGPEGDAEQAAYDLARDAALHGTTEADQKTADRYLDTHYQPEPEAAD